MLNCKSGFGGPNIIGVSAGYHDAACALLANGMLVAAAQEERFSRVKNDKAWPVSALKYCLKEARLAISDIDCVAFYEDPIKKLSRQIWMAALPELSSKRKSAILRRLKEPEPGVRIREFFGYEGPIEYVDHHLSHAASSFFCSGFEDASILTVDGVGDWPTTTYNHGKGMQITRLEQVDFPHSLGFLYSAITSFLGFEVNEGEYKVMGLAPYGRDLYSKNLADLIQIEGNGQFQLNLSYFSFLQRDTMFSERLSALLGGPARAPGAEITQFHMDVSKSLQCLLEEILLAKVKYLHAIAPSDNLCMAGGVALNVVANSRCLREGPFKKLFVQPAAGDAGSCIGAAAIAYTKLAETRPKATMDHAYFGPSIEHQDIRNILENSSATYEDYTHDHAALISRTVDFLSDGKIVGWAQGRMEFGPRALGARSILADPRRPEMKDRINSLIKQREGFRPFAPAVLESETSKHFALDHPSPFMLETCQVTSHIALPAITHVDGSARVQTINQHSQPRFFALVSEFFRRTGCPMLLNTSFNMKGEPIVCSPMDAILCFVVSGLDLLVIGDFMLDRQRLPPLWAFQARRLDGERENKRMRGRQPARDVYTLL